MCAEETLSRLRQLQAEADEIRKQLRIGALGEVLFLANRNSFDEELVVVEADGFGGAKTSTVEGNYPVDFLTHTEETFSTEAEALEAAANLVDAHDSFSVM